MKKKKTPTDTMTDSTEAPATRRKEQGNNTITRAIQSIDIQMAASNITYHTTMTPTQARGPTSLTNTKITKKRNKSTVTTIAARLDPQGITDSHNGTIATTKKKTKKTTMKTTKTKTASSQSGSMKGVPNKP
jgi:hypothetical protein